MMNSMMRRPLYSR